MTTRQTYYAESTNAQTTTSGSWQDGLSLTFTPDANATYLLLARAQIGISSGSYSSNVRFYNSTDSVEIQGCDFDVNGTLTSATLSAGFGGIYTAGGSPSSVTLKIQYCSSNTGNTCSVSNQRIIALRLESGDLYATGTGYSTGNTSFTNALGLTFSASSARYAILAGAEGSASQAVTGPWAELYDGSTSSFSSAASTYIRYSGNRANICLADDCTIASGTVYFRFRRSGGSGHTVYLNKVWMVALKLSSFDASYLGVDDANYATTSTSTVTGLTTTPTVSANKILVIGVARLVDGTVSRIIARMSADGVSVGGATYVSISGNERTAFFLYRHQPGAGSRNYNLNWNSTPSYPATMSAQGLAVLDLGSEAQTYQVAMAASAAAAAAASAPVLKRVGAASAAGNATAGAAAVERMPGAVPVTATGAVTEAAGFRSQSATPVTAAASAAAAAPALRRAGAVPVTAAVTVTEATVERMARSTPITAAASAAAAAPALRRAGATPVTAAASAAAAAPALRRSGAVPITAAASAADAAAERIASAAPVAAAATITEAAASRMPRATPVTAAVTVTEAAAGRMANAAPIAAAATITGAAASRMPGAAPVTAAAAATEAAAGHMVDAFGADAAAAVTDAAALTRAGAVPVTAAATITDAASGRMVDAVPVTAAASITGAAAGQLADATPVTAAAAVSDTAAGRMVDATPITATAAVTEAAAGLMPGAVPVAAAATITDAAIDLMTGAVPVTAATAITDAAASRMVDAAPSGAAASIGHNAGIDADAALSAIADADATTISTHGLTAAAALPSSSSAAVAALQRILDGATASIMALAVVDAARRGPVSAEATAEAAVAVLDNRAGSDSVGQAVTVLFDLGVGQATSTAAEMAAAAAASPTGAGRMPAAIAADAWASAVAASLASGSRGVAVDAAAVCTPTEVAALVAAMTATSAAAGQTTAVQRQLGEVQALIDAAAQMAASRVLRDAAMIEADAAQPVAAVARMPASLPLEATGLPAFTASARLFLQTALATMASGDHDALERVVADVQASSMATTYPATIAYTIEAMAIDATAGGPESSSSIERVLALSLACTVVAGAASRHRVVDDADLFIGAEAVQAAVMQLRDVVDFPAVGAASLVLAILQSSSAAIGASAEFGRLDVMRIQDVVAALAQSSAEMTSVAAIVDSGLVTAGAGMATATGSTIRTDALISGFAALHPNAALGLADAAALAAAGLAAIGNTSRSHAGLPVDGTMAFEAAALASSVGFAALAAMVELLPVVDAFTSGHMTLTADAGAAVVAKQALVDAMASTTAVTQQLGPALRANVQAALGAAAMAGSEPRQHVQAAAAIVIAALLDADRVAVVPEVVALTAAALAAAIATTTHRPPVHLDTAIASMEQARGILLAVAETVTAAVLDPVSAIRAADEMMAEAGAGIASAAASRQIAVTLLASAGDAVTEAVRLTVAAMSIDAAGATVADAIVAGASGVELTAAASSGATAIMTLVGSQAFHGSGLLGILSSSVLAGELITQSLVTMAGANAIRSPADLAIIAYAQTGQGSIVTGDAALAMGADAAASAAMGLRIPAALEVVAMVDAGTGLAWRGTALLPASAAAMVGAGASATSRLDARIEGEAVVVVYDLLAAGLGISIVSSVTVEPGALLRMAPVVALHVLAAQLAAGAATLLPGVRRVLLSAELHAPDALVGGDVSRETMQGDMEKSALTGEAARRDSLIGRVYTTITLTGN